jgi:hypothetical protein
LGFLLHKHPDRAQSFDLAFGKVHVFYPEATVERCTAALLLDKVFSKRLNISFGWLILNSRLCWESIGG